MRIKKLIYFCLLFLFSFFILFLCHFHLIWPFFFHLLDDLFILLILTYIICSCRDFRQILSFYGTFAIAKCSKSGKFHGLERKRNPYFLPDFLKKSASNPGHRLERAVWLAGLHHRSILKMDLQPIYKYIGINIFLRKVPYCYVS